MKKYLISLIVLVLLVGTTCQDKIDIEADIEAIKITHAEFDAAINAGDLDSWMSFYTDDAVRMSPNFPAFIGKNAIRDVYQSFFEQNALEGGGLIEEVIVCGDWAFIRGTATYTITPKASGEPIREYLGKWVAFNKRQPDGSWKYHCFIYNYDLPPSGVK